MDKGVLVLLDNDFEGIVPASKIKGSVTDYNVNDILSLNIEEINTDNRRIVLSINDKSEELDHSPSEEIKNLDEKDKSE